MHLVSVAYAATFAQLSPDHSDDASEAALARLHLAHDPVTAYCVYLLTQAGLFDEIS